jgi:hypothetical protein
MRKLITLIAALGACAPLARGAENHGFYVGAGADRVTVSTLPGSSTGYQAFVGYDFNRYLAIETDYLNIGNFSAGAVGPYPGSSALGTLSLSGETASVLGKLPLTRRFALFARLGGLYWRGQATATVYSNGFGVFTTSVANSGTAFVWGGGGQVRLGPFTLRAEYQQTDINAHRYRFAGGSLIYRF